MNVKALLPSLAITLCLAASFASKKKITIFMAGDSTMSVKDKKSYPETGWGMPFEFFWDDDITIRNYAKNGRSTSSFRQEGLWDSILVNIRSGDYTLIQFGHNDEVPTKKNYTTESQFKNNLSQFTRDIIAKGGKPVLITPVARRNFDELGKITETHLIYSGIVRSVAKEQNVPLIDLDKKSQQLYQSMGNEYSKLLFLYLAPGEHPNYPGGKQDDTHFSELGARKVAQLVLSEIRNHLPELAAYITKKETKE